MNQNLSAPVQQEERIRLIDALRGIAILGILLMNINGFGLPRTHIFVLNENEYSGPNYVNWWTINVFFEGSMRALLSMLFGISMYLLTERLVKRTRGLEAAEIYYRRLLWMLLFGLFHAFVLLWWGDILFTYAVMGMFVFPLRSLSARKLFIAATLLFLFGQVQENYLLYKDKRTIAEGQRLEALQARGTALSDGQAAVLAEWKDMKKKSDPTEREKRTATMLRQMKGTYADALSGTKDRSIELESTTLYQRGLPDILAFMVLGLALFKSGGLLAKWSSRTYAMLLLLGYGIGIPLRIWDLSIPVSHHFSYYRDMQTYSWKGYELGRLFITFGHIGLIMLAYRAGWFRSVFRILEPVGQMAFSNYLGQSILCTLFFYGYGFNFFGELQRYQLYYVVAAVWAFQILFSNLWLARFRFGPFEWLWRSATYWKAQPMRKTSKPREIRVQPEAVLN